MPHGRVLVIDDDTRVSAMLGDLLGVLGYDVTTVGNADDAMKAVASFQPDVVLLDWHMPDFGRFEGLDYFRRNHAGLPVIVVSGDAAVDVAHDVCALTGRSTLSVSRSGSHSCNVSWRPRWTSVVADAGDCPEHRRTRAVGVPRPYRAGHR